MKKILFLVLFLVLVIGCTQKEEVMEQDSAIAGGAGVTEGVDPAIAEGTEVMEEVEETVATAERTYVDVTPAEAKELIDTIPELVVIDVSPHYDEGHLPGAVHYYLGDGSLDAAIPTLDPSGEYLVYCHVDSVAISGAQKLVDAGFITVYRLEGNYGAWKNAGYPIEK